MVDAFDKQWEEKQKLQEHTMLETKRKELSREEVLLAQKEDQECIGILKAISGETVPQWMKNDAEQCVVVDDVVYHKDKKRLTDKGQLQLVTPQQFRRQLVEEIHGGVLGGHFGLARTLNAVRRNYWWHNMAKDVKHIIKGCPECNARNPERSKSRPFLQPEVRTAIPWERVGIDYTDMAKSQEGYSKIVVIIDHATKYVIAKATRDASAETAAKVLFEELICKFGAPKELWSDRGKAFKGEVVKYLSQLYGIQQKFTSGYHPPTNGLTERFNRTITAELAKVVNAQKDDWPKWLQAKVFAYNTTRQKATGYSPCELIFTVVPRTPMDNELVEPPQSLRKDDWAVVAKRRAEEMRKDALKNQLAAAESQKKQYDKGLKPETYKIGDLVRVKDLTAEAKMPVKLRNQWVGPYRVRGMRGKVLLILEDEKGARLEGLFHLSKVKKVNEEAEREGAKALPLQDKIDAAQATSAEGEV